MINQRFFLNLFTVIGLILLQAYIFNNINFLNIAFPLIYVIFILCYPLNQNRFIFLVWAFLLGIGIDFFDYNLGIHSFATVFIAFIRPFVIQLFKKKYLVEDVNYTLEDMPFWQTVIYTFILIMIHNTIVFYFDDVGLEDFVLYIQKVLYSAILSTVFVVLYLLLFKKKKT